VTPRGNDGYERGDPRPGPLVAFALALSVILGGSLAVSAWLERRFTHQITSVETVEPASALRTAPDAPALLAVPAEELALQRAREQHLLESTEWIDPVNLIVRIPIEQAMELVLDEGFPVREEAR